MDEALKGLYSNRFNKLAHYIVPSLGWALIKLHGSVNWGRRISNRIPTGSLLSTAINEHVDKLDLDNEITILGDHQERSRKRDDNFFYPALAVPLKGKNEFVCPAEQVHWAKSFIETCTDFLIIGFSGLDQHVINLFQGVQEVRKFRFVNGNEKAGRDASGIFFLVNNKFHSQSGVYLGGFGKFVASGELRTFLSYD